MLLYKDFTRDVSTKHRKALSASGYFKNAQINLTFSCTNFI